MARHDEMVAKKKKINSGKQKMAVQTIRAMVDSGEHVTVGAVIRRTGLSRSMFYQNPVVRSAMNDAKRSQLGTVYAREEKVVIQQAIQRQEELLRKKLVALRMENEALKKKLAEHGISF